MEEVYQAEAYRGGAIDSHGDASGMLIQQHQFPNVFDPTLDTIVSQYHDRIVRQEYEHATSCFRQHTGTDEFGFKNWVRTTDPSKVISFLMEILKADSTVTWTGFRILGTVNRSTGHPVWYLQLFAKNPSSKTVVYNTENAPNLIQGSRYINR